MTNDREMSEDSILDPEFKVWNESGLGTQLKALESDDERSWVKGFDFDESSHEKVKVQEFEVHRVKVKCD